MNQQLAPLFLCFCTTICYFNSFSQEVIEYTSSDELHLIGKKIAYLKDPSNSLDLYDIIASEDFVKSDKAYTNFPATNATYWIKFSARNLSNDDLLVQIGCGWIAKIDFYSKHPDGTYNVIETGYMRPFKNKDYPSNNIVIKLAERGDSGLKTFYIRFQTLGYGLDVPMYVGSSKQMFLSQQESDWLMAVYVGAVIIMICYNLIVYISVRDKSYFYYLVCLMSLLMIIPYIHGSYTEFWLYRNYGHLNFFFFSFSTLFPLASLLFLRSFLKIDWKASKSYRFSLVLLTIMLSFGLVNFVAGITRNYHWWQGLFSTIQLLTASIYNLVFLIMVIKSYLAGQKEVRYIAIGWSAFFTGIWLVVGAQQFQLFPIGFSKTILVIGSFIEIALFSTALSDKVNKLQKERNKAKAEALEQALEKEQIIQRQNEVLERKVHERTLELNDLNHNLEEQKDQLEEAIREKDGLMGIVAHDLSSPLNGIMGFTDLALSEQQLSENIRTYLDHISKLSDNGKKLIGDLLTISQTQKQLTEKDLSQIKVDEFFQELLVPFNVVAAKKNITYSHQLESTLPDQFFTEAISLRRIVENLVSNAIKFSPVDGMVSVRINSLDNMICIRIQDDGPGFTEEDRSKMFRKFQSLSARPTANESSTGLGLSIVKALCERLSASIEVQSIPGNGATFIIELPDLSPKFKQMLEKRIA